MFVREKTLTDKNGLIICTLKIYYTQRVAKDENGLADITLFLMQIPFKVLIVIYISY